MLSGTGNESLLRNLWVVHYQTNQRKPRRTGNAEASSRGASLTCFSFPPCIFALVASHIFLFHKAGAADRSQKILTTLSRKVELGYLITDRRG
jgi:hypothetical protein